MVTGLLSGDYYPIKSLKFVGGSGGGSRGFKSFSCMRTHAKQHAYYKISFFKTSMKGFVVFTLDLSNDLFNNQSLNN